MKLRIVCLILSLSACAAFADRYSTDTDAGIFTPSGGFYDNGEIPHASEIKCLLQKLDVDAAQAQKTGEAIEQALKMKKFRPNEFTRVSLLHFLATIKSESKGGKALIEEKPKSAEQTGYGLIQVTGQGNLKQAEKCMNDIQAGLGSGVSSNPAKTLGNKNDLLKPALASFCWWDQNMVKNNKHLEISKGPTEEDHKKVHEIVNTGRLGGKVTGGKQEVNERMSSFRKLQQGERQCRSISV